MRPERYAPLLLAVLFVALLTWCGRTSRTVAPIEALMPPDVSAAVRFQDLEQAFERHWSARGIPSTDEGVARVLQTFWPWEEWEATYGEESLRRRVTAFRQAFFQLIGPDAWLVFGEWPAAEPETDVHPDTADREGEPAPAPDAPANPDAETALLLYVREGTAVNLVTGPFIDLLVPEHRLSSHLHRGVEVQVYRDPTDRYSVQLARTGGWVFLSMRNPHSQAVERVIDQLLDAPSPEQELPARAPLDALRDRVESVVASAPETDPAAVSAEVADDTSNTAPEAPTDTPNEPGETDDAPPALSGWFLPDLFNEHLDHFDLQRGRRSPDDPPRERGGSEKRLKGIDAIQLVQVGDSILNLDFYLEGPRVHEVLTAASAPPPAAATPDLDAAHLPAIIAQIDLDYRFAMESPPLLGLDFEDMIDDDLDEFRLMAPGLENRVESWLYEAKAPPGARLGLAIVTDPGGRLPDILTWRDHPPALFAAVSPAEAWASQPRGRLVAGGDRYYATNDFPARPGENEAGDALARTQRAFANDLWSSAGTPPLLYFIAHLDALADWMDTFPVAFLSSEDREAFRELQRIVGGLRLIAGSLGLRLEPAPGDSLRLSLRTLPRLASRSDAAPASEQEATPPPDAARSDDRE